MSLRKVSHVFMVPEKYEAELEIQHKLLYLKFTIYVNNILVFVPQGLSFHVLEKPYLPGLFELYHVSIVQQTPSREIMYLRSTLKHYDFFLKESGGQHGLGKETGFVGLLLKKGGRKLLSFWKRGNRST